MKSIISGLLFFALLLASCQTKYDVGVSSVSIEPTDETVSLTLAGFAAPYLGRFTLTWENEGELEAIAMTQLKDEIFILAKDGTLSTMKNTDRPNVRKTGVASGMKYLAGLKEFLYGFMANGELWVCRPDTKLDWEKLGVLPNVTSFTASSDNLYVTTSDGRLRMGTVAGNDVMWVDVGEAQDVISMTCDARKLYAATANGWLLQRPLKRKNAEWLRMGYNNGDTYTIDVKHVVYAWQKLFAADSNGQFYSSRHSTAGNLTARAMAIRKGESTVVIAGIDACGFDYSFTQSVKEEISLRRAIPAEAIMINTSHSHFTPVTQKWLTWGKHNHVPDSLYLNQVVRKGIVRAIEMALDRMEPSYLYFGRDTTDVGHNRRLRKELDIYDNAVDVLKVTGVGGDLRSVLFLAGCHPVFTDPSSGHYTATANFPGYARSIIEEKTGASHAIFIQGCAGDINPKDPFKTSGAKLAGDVMRVLDAEMIPVKGNIRFVMDSLLIPTNPWSNEEVLAFKEASMGKTNDYVAERNIYWSDIMLHHYENGTMPKAMPIYIQTMNIGDWKLLGISREVTTEFSMAIRKIWPDKKVTVAAYTNDVASYLSTDPHIKAKDYEGYDSFFWYGQPSPFPLKTFDTVINYIKTNNR